MAETPADPTTSEKERPFALPSSRIHPGIYVSDFYVFRSLEHPGNSIQRHVELRRGLNILWADPNPPEKQAAGKRRKVAGHTAGKSTFCRLIRYALGDVSYGNDAQEGKITGKFNKGWVVLRVELEGSPWIIGRAFSDKLHSFAIPNGDLDTFLAGNQPPLSGYYNFTATLDKLFIKPLITQKFPGSRGEIQWRHLIPWFTRDQEARLLSLTTWRAPVGKTNALNIDSDERQFLMRLVLDLLPKREADEFDHHEELNEQKRELDKNLPLTKAKTGQAFSNLSEWLDLSSKGFEEPLFYEAAKAAHEKKEKELKELHAQLPKESDVQTAQDVWNLAGKDTAHAGSDLKAANRRVKDLEKLISDCEASRIVQLAILDDLKRHPPATVCGVPIDRACETGKLHHSGRPTKDAMLAIMQAIDESMKSLRANLDAAKQEVNLARVELATAKKSEIEAQTVHLTISTKRSSGLPSYLEANVQNTARKRVLEATRKVLERRTEEETRLDLTIKEINQSIELEGKHRKASNPHRANFSALYQRILRFMLGDDVTGSVDQNGRALMVTAEGRNDLDSGAITAAKLICFDLAAMAWSMEGRSHHPRFVIHDSPREADMAEDIYAGLFEAAVQMERCFPPGTEPNFQYIVTTTAAPPDALNQLPWRREPVLNALVKEKRILAEDL